MVGIRGCKHNENKNDRSVYLGQYVVNLGVHQSSSVSVLGDTKNLSTDLKYILKKMKLIKTVYLV